MGRLSLDAVIMGLIIGICAVLLESWAGRASLPLRLVCWLLVGGALCAVQYALMRWLRR
ncbi:MAG: hypothetical protein HGA65_08470 [Oscillochloris sp.]|nr:hypothetical protein [Oscillochloris sp.]